jgi:hypothetical protein
MIFLDQSSTSTYDYEAIDVVITSQTSSQDVAPCKLRFLVVGRANGSCCDGVASANMCFLGQSQILRQAKITGNQDFPEYKSPYGPK